MLAWLVASSGFAGGWRSVLYCTCVFTLRIGTILGISTGGLRKGEMGADSGLVSIVSYRWVC